MTDPKRRANARIGTCGFAEAQDKTFRDFAILEVQQTFYQPPMVSTAEKWRAKAPKEFTFTLKAWQLLTHEPTSPTYKQLKEDLSDADLAKAGGFRWNAVTRTAWQCTQVIADALDAEAVVFQTPKSFRPTAENLRRPARFFEQADRRGRRMVFEPRGDAWDDATVRKLVTDLELTHAVAPFLRRPVGRGLRDFRLHGRPAYHYRYRYTDEDLRELQGMLSWAWPNWVLFNNDAMAADAVRFLHALGPGDPNAG